MMVFLCNIPFLFLPGKEALLLMIDESMNMTMSIALMKRIDQIKNGLLLHPNDTATQTSYLLLNYKEEEDEVKAESISNRVSNSIYYVNAVGLFTLELICAILIDDITIIFGFLTAIAESMLTFFMPAAFYLLSCKVTNTKANIFLKLGCYLYFILGTILFTVTIQHNVRKLTS